jgi:thiol-disulfide isomerase/thioredoxin
MPNIGKDLFLEESLLVILYIKNNKTIPMKANKSTFLTPLIYYKFLLGLILLIISLTDTLAQDITTIKLKQLQSLYKKSNDTVYVVNFWATWCGPCVKELPDFEKINQDFKNKPFRLYLISLDFAKDLPKVQKFKKSKDIQSTIYLLDEPNYNQWIDQIEPLWGGSIPATIIYKNNQKQHFVERQTDYNSLIQLINPLF